MMRRDPGAMIRSFSACPGLRRGPSGNSGAAAFLLARATSPWASLYLVSRVSPDGSGGAPGISVR
ncbi:hypothetical protein D0T12_08595 [Actinomadura spongiicola]|uniref:Uncharacterized protein n=1 Tax=Actinomadura spongiicola TaxID=2303421 RepID=A0A372GMI4_9ACTN|nr:hypothetical protein D0T12_08595 [Actinomadura spongiicola]